MTDNTVTVTQINNSVSVTQSSPQVVVSSIGMQGPPGIQGAIGGAYVFEKQSNSVVWNINHNLGYKPNVSIIDYGNNNIEADIVYVDGNNVTINFMQPSSGYAYLS